MLLQALQERVQHRMRHLHLLPPAAQGLELWGPQVVQQQARQGERHLHAALLHHRRLQRLHQDLGDGGLRGGGGPAGRRLQQQGAHVLHKVPQHECTCGLLQQVLLAAAAVGGGIGGHKGHRLLRPLLPLLLLRSLLLVLSLGLLPRIVKLHALLVWRPQSRRYGDGTGRGDAGGARSF